MARPKQSAGLRVLFSAMRSSGRQPSVLILPNRAVNNGDFVLPSSEPYKLKAKWFAREIMREVSSMTINVSETHSGGGPAMISRGWKMSVHQASKDPLHAMATLIRVNLANSPG